MYSKVRMGWTRNSLRGLACLGLILTSYSFAQEAQSHDRFTEVDYAQDVITLTANKKVEGMVLVITGPNGYVARQEFTGNDPIFIDTLGLEGDWLRDGHYTFEVRGTPVIDADVKDALRAARANGERVNVAMLRKQGDLPEGSFVQAGYFFVRDGQFIVTEAVEQAFVASKTGDDGRAGDVGPGNPVGGVDPGGTVDFGEIDSDSGSRDNVIADDLIVDGSACVGLDCANGESFGFDTLKLKENNLRIKFEDTSASASFPGNDWQITANESDNGGANKFSIDDIDGGKTPFTIIAGAPSNSLYVNNAGNLGVGTASPVVETHITDGDSPTIRLEQDGSSGFTSQTWDIAGNETNFFVRDVTNSSKLPFKIRPKAPTDSLYVDLDGDIGLNKANPTADLHMVSADGDAQFLMEETNATATFREMIYLKNNGNIALTMENTDNNTIWQLEQNNGDFRIDFAGVSGSEFIFFDTGRVTLGPGGGPVFDLAATGALVISGALTQNSDRNVKENIVPVDEDEVLARVAELPITTWNYTDEEDVVRHMGPMAQDFYQAFGLNNTDKGISSVDTTGVAFAAIKALNNKLVEVEELKQQNQELNAKLAHIEAMMEELSRQLIRPEEK